MWGSRDLARGAAREDADPRSPAPGSGSAPRNAPGAGTGGQGPRQTPVREPEARGRLLTGRPRAGRATELGGRGRSRRGRSRRHSDGEGDAGGRLRSTKPDPGGRARRCRWREGPGTGVSPGTEAEGGDRGRMGAPGNPASIGAGWRWWPHRAKGPFGGGRRGKGSNTW